MPVTITDQVKETIFSDFYSHFSHETEKVSPGYHYLELNRYDIKAEITSTKRVGFHKYTFNGPGKPALLVNLSELQFYFVSGHPYELIVNEEGNRLYGMLKEFRENTMKLTGDDKLERFIEEQLKLESSRGEGADEWARYCFVGPFFHSVNMLSMYESVIRMLEYQLMRELK